MKRLLLLGIGTMGLALSACAPVPVDNARLNLPSKATQADLASSQQPVVTSSNSTIPTVGVPTVASTPTPAATPTAGTTAAAITGTVSSTTSTMAVSTGTTGIASGTTAVSSGTMAVVTTAGSTGLSAPAAGTTVVIPSAPGGVNTTTIAPIVPVPASVPVPRAPSPFAYVVPTTFAATPVEFMTPVLVPNGAGGATYGCTVVGYSLGYSPSANASRCAKCPVNSIYDGLSGRCEACPAGFQLIDYQTDNMGNPITANGYLQFRTTPACKYIPSPDVVPFSPPPGTN